MVRNRDSDYISAKRQLIMWKTLGILIFLAIQLTIGATESRANPNIVCTLKSALNFAPVLDASGFGRDTPIGGTTPNYSTPVNFNCSGDPQAERDIFLGFTPSPATVVSGYTDLYTTNVPSVGVRYIISNGAGTGCTALPMNVSSGGTQVTCHQLVQPASPGENYSVIVSAQFVKIANGPLGPLTTIPALSLVGSSNQPGTWTSGNVFSGVVSGNFSALTCSVTTPSIAVSMPQANTNRLPSVGSTDGTTAFNMGLSCDPGVKAYVTLTDATAPSNTTSTLSLASDSTATGVGFQVLYNNNPVSFGSDSAAVGNLNQFAVMASPATGGPVNIPFSGRYIRIGAIAPGTVKALATFTMSYQ